MQIFSYCKIYVLDKNSAEGSVVPGKDLVTKKYTKGHYSINNVGGVKVLVLYTSFDNASYLY